MITIQDVIDCNYHEYEGGEYHNCDRVFYKTIMQKDTNNSEKPIFQIEVKYYNWAKYPGGEGQSFTFSGCMYESPDICWSCVINSFPNNITIYDIESRLINMYNKMGFVNDPYLD